MPTMPKLKSGIVTSQSAGSLSDDLLECCRSEALSENRLRELIEQHTPNDSSVGDYEFFRAASRNQRVTEGIIRCLLEYFPNAVGAIINFNGWLPLHFVCDNKNVTLNIVQLLLVAAPDSVRSVNNYGSMPLHCLCDNEEVNEKKAMQILKFLLEKYPDAVRHADSDGDLPIHHLRVGRSLEFCRLLIDADPDTVQSVNNDGLTPLHMLCVNQTKDEETASQVLKMLIEKYPEALRHTDNDGDLPIHLACVRRSPEFCQILINSAPDSVRCINNDGGMPLHALCSKGTVNGDGETARQTLKLLVEKYPESVQCADNDGDLPIHTAAYTRSPEFCRVLFEAYPGSERISNADGALPLHWASWGNSVATVEYLHNLYPDAIHRSTTDGLYPIHDAIRGTNERDNPVDALEIVKFLLGCDPDVKRQMYEGMSVLEFACDMEFNDSNIGAGIQIIDAIYGAHPEAIEDNRVASDNHHFHPQVQEFLNSQLVYARQAEDLRMMTTPDGDGRLPLHKAIQNNGRLGSIKLLVKGNRAAVQSADSRGALPLHMACQYHDSTSIIQYLLCLDDSSLDATDRERNTALHYACRGAKYVTIAMFLEKYDAASVSKRNAYDKLPIDLLWESNEVSDRENLQYMDSVFQLLRAYPEMIAISNNFTAKQPVDADATRNRKKRKMCHDDEE